MSRSYCVNATSKPSALAIWFSTRFTVGMRRAPPDTIMPPRARSRQHPGERRESLGEGWMDMHGAVQRLPRRARLYVGQDNVDQLAGLVAHERRAENPVRR